MELAVDALRALITKLVIYAKPELPRLPISILTADQTWNLKYHQSLDLLITIQPVANPFSFAQLNFAMTYFKLAPGRNASTDEIKC